MALPLRNRIVLTAISGAAVVIVLASLEIWHEYSSAIDNAKDQVLNRSIILSEHAARSFEGVDLMMDAALSHLVLTPDGNPELTLENVSQFKTLIEAVPQIRHLVAIRRDGNDTFSNIGAARGVNLADRSYFRVQEMSENAGLYIDDPVVGRATGSMFIPVSRRISGSDGRFDGVLMGVLDQEYFMNFYNATQATRNISSALVSSNGTIFAFSDGFLAAGIEVTPHSLAGSGFFKDNHSVEPNDIHVGSLFGAEEISIVAFRKISKTPYTIVSRISRNRALSTWLELAISIVVTVLVAATALAWLTRNIIGQISLKERAEEETRNLNADLEQRVKERTAELRAAQVDLLRKERLATLGQLTATVSHELRNPLGVIRTSAYVVRSALNEEAPNIKRSLERIERSIVRCDRIIDELLDFTRISDLVLEPTAIDAWLEETLNEQAMLSGITLRLEFGMPDVAVPFDRDRFRRAIINVFDNGCQAMVGDDWEDTGSAEHSLTVLTQEHDGRVEVIFEDTGPGIPPDVYENIFEPLYSTKGFGVGLGLPVVKQIMEQHDGGIEIESEEGRGTRACLWLPTNPSAR